jgi:hypothetical protein
MTRAVWLLAVCACSEPRLLLELDTPDGPMRADTLELILAEPSVGSRGDQRTNSRTSTGEIGTETVYYLAQRNRIDFNFDGEEIDGFTVQLVAQEVEAYIPIVVARDTSGAIIGLGSIPDEFNETTLRRVDYLYDVTHYTVEVEPVAAPLGAANDTNTPRQILEGQMIVVPCDQLGISGYAWRPKTRGNLVRPQLRILLPFDRPDGDAVPRLFNGPDLDCDMHTPLERGEPGDQLDCDDTTPIVFGGPPPEHEMCDFVDNDCNERTFGATVVADKCAICSRKGITCSEDSADFTPPLCPESLAECPICPVLAEKIGAEVFGCPTALTWTIPVTCGTGCTLRLVEADPRWDVALGDPGNPEHGLFERFHPETQVIEIALSPRGSSTFPSIDGLGGTFVVMLRSSPTADPVMFDLGLELTQPNMTGTCPASPAPGVCQ